MINQRAEAELNSFQETLRMRVAELSEVERLFEERVKKQFEDFLAEFEKRWGKLDPRIDERWHEHERVHRAEGERLERLEAAPAPLQEQITDAAQRSRQVPASLYRSGDRPGGDQELAAAISGAARANARRRHRACPAMLDRR